MRTNKGTSLFKYRRKKVFYRRYIGSDLLVLIRISRWYFLSKFDSLAPPGPLDRKVSGVRFLVTNLLSFSYSIRFFYTVMIKHCSTSFTPFLVSRIVTYPLTTLPDQIPTSPRLCLVNITFTIVCLVHSV